MAQQGSYPIGTRILAPTDTATGVVTAVTADIPLGALATFVQNYIGTNSPLGVAQGGTGAVTLSGYVFGNGVSPFTSSPTIPNTAITGLGTMSTQNSGAVGITGGSITGTTISGSTGSFTTVTASTSFSGPGTGLTGTAAGLSIGGTAATATNLAGGSANQIHYQLSAGSTAFAVAPVSANTVLGWTGSAFAWTSPGTGTVTSVAVSGGTTGLTTSGGPITSSGTITFAGTLAVANGGTGGTTQATARTGLGAAASGANNDITSLTGLTTPLSVAQGGTGSKLGPVLAKFLSGLALSTAGGSTTMTTAAGQAIDSTNSVLMTLAASISKTTAAWAVGTGNGGKLSAAAIANSTWYYFFEINRPDTGVVDIGFDVSPTAPTMPANYTSFRYIGAGFTDGSANWTAFTQWGNDFYWSTPVLDLNGAGSTTAVLLTCSIPRGRKMKAFFNTYVNNGANGVYISDPANADLTPSAGVSNPLASAQSSGGSISAQSSCWSDTSARIRHREINTGLVALATLGWTDLRDRI